MLVFGIKLILVLGLKGFIDELLKGDGIVSKFVNIIWVAYFKTLNIEK